MLLKRKEGAISNYAGETGLTQGCPRLGCVVTLLVTPGHLGPISSPGQTVWWAVSLPTLFLPPPPPPEAPVPFVSEAVSALSPLVSLPVSEASENRELKDWGNQRLMALLWTGLFSDLCFLICSMGITYQLHGVAWRSNKRIYMKVIRN